MQTPICSRGSLSQDEPAQIRVRSQVADMMLDESGVDTDFFAGSVGGRAIRTEQGALVYVQNPGIRTAAPDVMQKLLAGQAVDPKLV